MSVIKTGPAAWAKATGAGVKVGVIDGGLEFTHPDLAGAIDVGLSCSFILSTTPTADSAEIANGDCANKAAVQDLQGHGTHVATTIASRFNGIGIVGVAPQATVVGLEACTIAGFCFADSVAAALRFAGDHKLDVVNLSLFADPYLYFCANDAGQRAMLLDLQKAARYAEQRGVVIVAAAGNEAQDLGHPTEDTISPDWPPDTAIVRTVRNNCRVAPAEPPGDGLRTRAHSRRLVEHRRHWHLGGFDPGEPRGRHRWRSLCVDQWYVDGVTALIRSKFPNMPQGAVAALFRSSATPTACPEGWPADYPRQCTGSSANTSFFGGGIVNALGAVSR